MFNQVYPRSVKCCEEHGLLSVRKDDKYRKYFERSGPLFYMLSSVFISVHAQECL